jgi:RNA polymerase sigma factor (sigma-70 family)
MSEGRAAILESGAKDEPLAIAVAHRRMVDYLRKESRRQRDRDWPAVQDTEPDGTNAALWEAMKALPARQYTAIHLQGWMGCSCEEIAERMGITPRSVEGLLSRARKFIKEFLGTAGVLGV